MLPTLSPLLVLILQVIHFHPTTYCTPSPELHLCNRIETYMDNVEVLVEEPVKMKRYQWCVGVPPRCTTFTTELKNRTKIEAVEKNRTVTECCTGFVEINSECVRECPPNQPCPNMKCQDTKHCFCLAGYTGLYCNTTCPVGRWGSNCTSKCQCGDVNGNKCHHLTGKCILLTPATVPTLPTETLMPSATIPTLTSSTQQVTTPTLATPSTTTQSTTTTQRPTTSTTTTTTPKPTTPTTTVVTTTPTPPSTTIMQLPNLIPSSIKPLQPLNPLGPGIFTNLDTSLFETAGFLTTKPPVDTTKQGGNPFTNLDSVNAFDHYSTKMNMHPTTPFNGENEFPEKGISGLPGVPALPTIKAEEDWPYTIPKLTTVKPSLNPGDLMSKVANQLENVPTPIIPLQTTRKPIIDDDLIVRKIAPIAEAVPKSLPGFDQSSGSRLNIMTTQSSMNDVGLMNNNNRINMDTISNPQIPDTIPRTFSDIPFSFPAGTTTPRPLIDGIIENISPTTAKPSAIDMINKGFIPNVIPSSIIPSAQPTLPTIPSEVPLIPTQAGSKTRVIDKLNIISSELDKGFKSVVSSVINKYNNSSNPPTTTPKSFYGVVNTVVNKINITNHQSGIDGLINHMKPKTNTIQIPDTTLPTLPAAIPTFPAVKADFGVPDLIPSTEVSPFVTPSKDNSIDSILSAMSTNKPSIPVPSLPPNVIQPILPAMTTARPSIPNISIPNIPQTLNESIQHSLPNTTVSTLVNLGRDVVSNVNALGAGVNTNFMNPSTRSNGHPVGPVPTMVSMNPVSNHNNIPELTETTGQSLSHVPPTSDSSHNVNIPSIPINLNRNVTLDENLHQNIISPAVPNLSTHHSTVQPRETSPHFMTHNLNLLTTTTLPTYKHQSQTNFNFSHKLDVSLVPTHGVPELHSYQPSSTIAPLVNSLHNVVSHLPTIPDNTLNIPPLTHPSLPSIPSSQSPTLLMITPHPATDFQSQPPTFQEAPIINDDFHSLSPPVSVPPQNAVTPQYETLTLQTASPKLVNPDLDKAIGIFENSLNDLMKEMEGIGLKKASDMSKNSKSMPSRRTFGQKVDLPKDKFDQALDGGLNQLRHDMVNLQPVSQNDEPSRDKRGGIQNDGPKQEGDDIKPEPEHEEGPQNYDPKAKLKFDSKTNFWHWDLRVVLPKKPGGVGPPGQDPNNEDSLVDSGPRQDVASLRLGSPNSVFSQVAAISEEDNEFMRDGNYHPTSVGLNLIYIPDDIANQQQADSATMSSQFFKSVPVTVSSIVLILCLVLTGLCYVLHRRRRRRNESAVVDETARREERLEENTRETGSLERRTQLQESFCRFVNPHSMQMLTELKESQYQSPPTPQPIYEEIQW